MTPERRRLANQMRATARSGADAPACHRALEHFASTLEFGEEYDEPRQAVLPPPLENKMRRRGGWLTLLAGGISA